LLMFQRNVSSGSKNYQSINQSTKVAQQKRDISLSRCRVLAYAQDHISSVTVLLAHLPLFWYCQSCTHCLHSSTPTLSLALLESSGTNSITYTVFIVPISVSAGLYIRLCPNLPIHCEVKWWTI
jgi:hypothetical protein